MVWLYDANIDYLSGKHIPLFIVAVLVFLFLFLPYTLLLLFGQWLQAISHLRLFSWVNSARLKPFMDSYHAPYKANHRYWPGLLLVLCGAFKACMTQISDGEIEVESDTNSLPHRVLNPGEYEPVPQTAQGKTSAEPTGSDDEEPRKRISVYTYSSLN